MGNSDPHSIDGRVVDLLTQLIAINSVNPALEDGGRGEEQVAALIEERSRQAGLDVRRQPVLPGRDNVLASLNVSGARQTLLFESHMDTVAVATMGERALRPEVRDGRVYGRGACDDKGSLAAMMIAMELLAERRRELRVNVMFLAAIDEEYQFRGVMDFVARKVPVDGAVVGEPTDLRLVVAHKGVVRWRLSTIGLAAHSSKPHVGVSAIEHMAEVVLALRDLQRRLKGRPHSLAGHPTVNVGLISGGVAANVLAPSASAELMFRTVGPSEDVLAAIDAALVEGVTRRLLTENAPELFDVPAGYETGVANFNTDASFLKSVGPILLVGPGDIEVAHSEHEHITLDQLSRGADLYEQLTSRFLGSV
jgi:acetylornithine deacetylase